MKLKKVLGLAVTLGLLLDMTAPTVAQRNVDRGFFAFAAAEAAAKEEAAKEADSKKEAAETKKDAGDKDKKVKHLEIQEGKEIDRIFGDVDGDGKEEEIYLMGTPMTGGNFMGDAYVLTREPGNPKVKSFVRPKDLGGYNGSLSLADVTGDGVKDLLITMPTGGSGGIVDYRIINFVGPEPKEIFTREDNEGTSVNGQFLPDYKVELHFPELKTTTVVDISNKKDMYKGLRAYDDEGNLLSGGFVPYAGNLSSLLLSDVDGDGIAEAVTTQRVAGVNNTDTLGYIRATKRYLLDRWQDSNVHFVAELKQKESFLQEGPVVQKEYTIRGVRVETDEASIKYPLFQGMKNKRAAWLLNTTMSSYLNKQLESVRGKGRLEMTYEVKFSGKRYASLLVTGMKNVGSKPTRIVDVLNVEVPVGSPLKLENVVGRSDAFWTYAEGKAKEAKLELNKKNLRDFYFDASAVTLIDEQGAELVLRGGELNKFLKRTKAGREILAKQAEEAKKSKSGNKLEKAEKA